MLQSFTSALKELKSGVRYEVQAFLLVINYSKVIKRRFTDTLVHKFAHLTRFFNYQSNREDRESNNTTIFLALIF